MYPEYFPDELYSPNVRKNLSVTQEKTQASALASCLLVDLRRASTAQLQAKKDTGKEAKRLERRGKSATPFPYFSC